MVNEPKIQHPASNSLISCFPDIHFLITGLPDILLCLSAFVATLIMQNKPNFPKIWSSVSYAKTKCYKIAPSFFAQFSQSQFWPTVFSYKARSYKNETPFFA